MKKERYFYCSADFETTTPDWSKELKDDVDKTHQIREWFKAHPDRIPVVYSWAVCFDIKYKKKVIKPKNLDIGYRETDECIFFYGITGETFLSFFDCQIRNWNIFFHNLKGFDGHFILPILYNHGCQEYPRDETFNTKSRQTELEFFYNEPTSWRKALPFEYRPMIERNQKIYKIDYWIPNNDKKSTSKIRCLIFKDSLLMFNTSIEEMGNQLINYNVKQKILDKTTATNKYQKGKIGYLKTEPYSSLEAFENDSNELEYLLQDTYILQQFIHLNSINLQEYMPIHKWGLTQGATAIKSWKEELGKELFLKNQDNIQERHYSNGLKKYRYGRGGYYKTKEKIHEDLVNWLLPIDWLQEGDTFIDVYQYYKGGMTLINEEYRGKVVDDVYVLDIVSSYPTIMNSDFLCPIGIPCSENEGDLHLYQVKIKSTLTNSTGIPFMSKYIFEDTMDEDDGVVKHEYKSNVYAGEIYFLDSYSFKAFIKYYHAKPDDYEATIKYSFKAVPFKTLFGSYIGKWYPLKAQAKADHNDFLKNFTKVMLNAIYGKFATKILHERNFWNPETREFEKVTEKTNYIMFLPIALFITSLARLKLIEAIGNDVKGFIYCDTDSIFIKGWLKDKIVKENRLTIGEELGDWEIENNHPYKMVGRRAKQYLAICSLGERNCDCKKPIKLAYAGINFLREDLSSTYTDTWDTDIINQKIFKDNISYDDFIFGKIIPNQLQPMKVLGSGVCIYEMIKQIKAVWDYPALSEQIYKEKDVFIANYKKTSINPL